VIAAEPVPHPDHVVIDFDAGAVRFAGPVTREEQAVFALWTGRKRMLEQERAELIAELADASAEDAAEIRGELAKTEHAITYIAAALEGSREALRVLQRLHLPAFEEVERAGRA
jgi:hypothetical protein